MGKRRYVQLLSAIIYNINVKGFTDGSIFNGSGKGVCVPGLNCYSCPGAVGACPLGALQGALNSLPTLPLYVLGTILIFGALLGRMICAFLCPFGLIQELLYKIPTPKIKKGNWSRRLSGLKYVILAVFVLAIPIFTLIRHGVVIPAFCKWICPAGTLEGGVPLAVANPSIRGMLGGLFSWKLGLMVAILLGCVFIHRLFCRFLCPLGAIYGFFNRFALLGIRVDEAKCTHCDRCVRQCKMDVKHINDRECIRCGECADCCPCGAIDTRLIKRRNEK